MAATARSLMAQAALAAAEMWTASVPMGKS